MGKKKKKKRKQLTGMAAELAKAGVISDKEAGEICRAQRKHAREVGREQVAAEERAAREQFEAEREHKREEDRRREEEAREAKQRERVEHIYAEGRVRGQHGNHRFYFIARDNRILFLDLSDTVNRELVDGRAGIVEAEEEGDHLVLRGRHRLEELAAVELGRIRFWNR